MPANDGEVNKNNKMGRWGATSYIVGNIVGAGIFVAPSAVSDQVQSVGMSLTVWLLSAIICTLGGFCYLELGTAVARSGGDFAYLCFVGWRPVAFAFMVTGCLLVYPMQLAIAATASADYLLKGFALDCVPHAIWLRKLIGFCVVWTILFLNFFSVRRVVAPFQIASSVAKLVACGLVILAGAYQILIRNQTQNFHDPFANSSANAGHLANALFAGFYSYDGWDILNWGAEEVENPRSIMVFAMLTGMACVSLLYLAMNVAYFSVMNVDQIRLSDAVAISFGQLVVGQTAASKWLIPLLINLVLLGSINGTMFIASRFFLAAAREHQLPAFFAGVNERHGSPRAALFVHVLIGFFLSFLGSPAELMSFMGFVQWLQRCFTVSALLYIRLSAIPVRQSAMQTPLFLPLLFLAFCLALVIMTLVQQFHNAIYGLAVLGIATILYAMLIWEKGLPRYAMYRRLMATVNDWLCKVAQIAFNGENELPDGEQTNRTI